MQILKYRDLTLIDIDENKFITVVCDSCGGIGNSEFDVVKISNDIVGYFTARVCLFETLCFGATPLVIVNNFCLEMEPRGAELLVGINRAIEEYNKESFSRTLLKDSLTGSTEENFKTLQTAIGMTVIGEKNKKNIRDKAKAGDYVISVGIPKVGQEVIEDINLNKGEIVSFNSLNTLINKINIKDILPVGSKGILYELSEMERTNNIKIKLKENIALDLKRSGGPSTTVLALLSKEELFNIESIIKEPINILGEVI